MTKKILKDDTKYILKILFVFILIFSYPIYFIGPYFVAHYQYEKLANKPNIKFSKKEIENELFWYSDKQISIEESNWGKFTKLKNGEYCMQYLILWIEPIDVVYDENNTVVHIFSSYE